MEKLNFPDFSLPVFEESGKQYILDIIRKKPVVLTPEEWVRQHVLAYFMQVQQYPGSLIAVERSLTFNKLSKRFDILVYNRNGEPFLLAECKAPSVTLDNKTLFQIATYNMVFGVPYLFISNGLGHSLYALNTTGNYEPVQTFPML